MPPQGDPVFLGFYADDLRGMAGVTLFSLVIAAVLLIFVRPFVVVAAEALPAKRRIRWQDYPRHAKKGLKLFLIIFGIWGLSLAAIGVFFTHYDRICEGREDACLVWSESLIPVVGLAYGAYFVTHAVFRISWKGWQNYFYRKWFQAEFAILVGAITLMALDWPKYFGGNCPQVQSKKDAPIIPTVPIDPRFPFNPGNRVNVTFLGWSIKPAYTGYCIPVGPNIGATGTVVAHAPAHGKGPPLLVVKWDTQPFRELSWIGFILDRRPVLESFISTVPPSFFVAPRSPPGKRMAALEVTP
jgi:hypothetical protein